MQERLQQLLEELDGPRLDDLADELSTSTESVRRMMHELGYRYVLSRWIPHELSRSQLEQRVKTARRNLRQLKAENNLLGRIIAIDETWLPSYMPLTDQQARQWVGPGERP